MPAFFQGKTLYAPQVTSIVDDAALASQGVSASATVAVVGESTGGKPNTALSFTRSSDALTALRTGKATDVVRRVFDPGAGNTGASRVIVVRVANGALQSARTLADGVSNNSVVVTSVDYGAWNNQVRVKVQAGTTQGKKVTVAAPVNGVVQNVILDDLYRALMTVLYTGAGSASTMTITSTAVTTTCTGAAGDDQNILFTTAPTIQVLVDALNATGKYAASVLALGTEATTTLDGLTAGDIKTTTRTLTATQQAIIDGLNKSGQTFVTAAKGSNSILPPADTAGFLYLTGGSDGSAVTNGDWTTALNVLATENVGIVTAATDSATIHAAVSAHVTDMSSVKRERVAVIGGAAGETVSQAITRSVALGSDRVCLVFPGISDSDLVAGTLTAYAPYVTAAAVAGLLAGGKTNQAATYRFIGAIAMEKRLTDAEVDSLLIGGVIPVQNVTGRGNRVVRSLTTQTSNSNLVHNEISVRRAADSVAATVRDANEPLVGTTTGPELVGLAFSNTTSALQSLVAEDTIVSFKNVSVKLEGSVVAIEFAAAIGVPANWVTITAHLSPFSA